MTGDAKYFRRSPILAYLASVTAVAVVSVLFAGIVFIGEPIIGDSLWNKFLYLLKGAGFTFVVAWLITCIAALLPFTLVLFFAKETNKKSQSYFMVSGALASLASGAYLVSRISDGPISNFRFWKPILEFAPFFLIAGLVAGITCWRVIRPR